MVEKVKQEELANEINESAVEPVLEAQEAEEKSSSQAAQESNTDGTTKQSATGDDEEYNNRVQNWRALREQKEQERRERIRIQKERDELAARLQSQQGQQQVNEDDDDLVEKRHLRQTEQKLQQVEARLIDAEIRSKFPDWSDVVNDDTIAMLKDADPDLAESIASNRNVMGQAASVYKAIKLYGLAKPSYQREKEIIAKNSIKPRPASSVNPQQGDSPLSRANAFAQGLTEDRKQQIWDEMQQIIKNR